MKEEPGAEGMPPPRKQNVMLHLPKDVVRAA